MDWDLAIKRNSEALNTIVAALFAMLGLAGEATVARIPQTLHSAVLRVLRPAESAVRRLIVIAARGIVLKLAASRPMPAGPIFGKGRHSRPSFQLFDPRKNFESLRRHHLMAWSMPSASAAGFRPSSWHSRICRARPGGWPAGG